MGKGEIIAENGLGSYSVKIIYGYRDKVEQRIGNMENQIILLNQKIALAEEGLEKQGMELQVKALEKQIWYLGIAMPADPTRDLWCSDFTTGLTGDVGLIEIPDEIAEKISTAITQGLIVSCHDCSEGGLAVALAEMAFAGGLGIEADLRGLPRSDDCSRADTQLFSESNSRFIVEVQPENYDAFAKLMLNLPFGQIGKITEEKTLIIKAPDGKAVIELDLDALKQAWQKPLDWNCKRGIVDDTGKSNSSAGGGDKLRLGNRVRP